MRHSRTKLALSAALTLSLGVVLAACGGSDSGGASGGASGGSVKLTLSHSYTEDQPQSTCGAKVIKDEVEKAKAGMNVEIFPASQLGGDADRIASVKSGDIDIDIQGASALASVYKPIGVVDAAYAFKDGDHLVSFFQGKAADKLKQDFDKASGMRIMGAWSTGARQFTANKELRVPSDLKGLRMRFPGSPQFLLNAKALGAQATAVAYEELYLALQQGVVDGQENPITNIAASNLVEVQDFISMSSHAQSSNLLVVGPVWEKLDAAQRKVLTAAVDVAVKKMPGCVATAETKILDGWKQKDKIQIVDDVDTAAFSAQTDKWFRANLTGDSLAVFEAIKSSAP